MLSPTRATPSPPRTQAAEHLSGLQVGGVPLALALGLWLMMLPVLTAVRYELLATLLRGGPMLRQLGASAGVNWIIGPALMTGLAWACLPDLPAYRDGVILVGIARCIAMVLLWNQLARGDAELCALMVAVNSVLQLLLYAPLAAFYLQVRGAGGVEAVRVSTPCCPLAEAPLCHRHHHRCRRQVVSRSTAGLPGAGASFWLVAKSVLLFLGVPLAAGVALRYALLAAAPRPAAERAMRAFNHVAPAALLYTIVVLFAAQGRGIVEEAPRVARVAVPLLAYFALMFFGTLAAAWKLGGRYEAAVTQAFTAASNK